MSVQGRLGGIALLRAGPGPGAQGRRLPLSSRVWFISIRKSCTGLEVPWMARAATVAAGRCSEHLRGDALHNLGRLLEAHAAYSEAVRLTGNDPVLSSKLGYTEVRLGRAREGIKRLKQAAEKAPEVAEIRERLMKALVAPIQPDRCRRTGGKTGELEGTAKAIFAPPAFECMPGSRPEPREVLHRGIAALS